ncbi:unnamed protein product [Rotaria sp. Silwood2]|nr:unnamed protein product [Rotaria sp. Silwood2]CAF2844572.1 unnamed protein product [Rotaria sp. Silwood2]CAF3328508.1 unnamed protein product [Rotaria sp. Silwood2]CAF4116603.1 unnamed protein product [Rotaria sp. Silwood2]CAF4157705.1 unnamed protein product [Rotaria sp. Silwood2]
MTIGKDRKRGLLNLLVRLTFKPPPIKEEVRSKSPVPKFVYQLPKSFFEAVDNARLDAGYDALPRFHQSPSSPRETLRPSLAHRSKKSHHSHRHDHNQARQQHTRSSSKKVRFNLEPQKSSHHQSPFHQERVTQYLSANLPKKRNLSATASI